jgi:hypothetical protein
MRVRSPTCPIMDRGRTSEYFKIGSGRTPNAGASELNRRRTTRECGSYRDIQDPLRMGQATCFPGVAAESSAAELEEHTTSGPRFVKASSNLRSEVCHQQHPEWAAEVYSSLV